MLQRSIQSSFEAFLIVLVAAVVVIVVIYGIRYQIACCILNAAARGQCCDLGGRYKLRGFRPNCTKIEEFLYLQFTVNRAICEATT